MRNIVGPLEVLQEHKCENCGVLFRFPLNRLDEVVVFRPPYVDENATKLKKALQFLDYTEVVPCPNCGWYQKRMAGNVGGIWFSVGLFPMWLAGIAIFLVPSFGGFAVSGRAMLPWYLGGGAVFAGGFVLGYLLKSMNNINGKHPGNGGKLEERAQASRATVVAQSATEDNVQ